MSLRWLAGACLLLASSPARAEVRLEKVEWQLAAKAGGRAVRYEPVKALSLAEKGARRLRARLTLRNKAPKAVEGVLLKYSLSARLLPAGTKDGGVWAVPFMLYEKRVPKVGPDEAREVSLEPALLAAYLARISREGFYPDQVRLLVMIEPRPGQEGPLQTLESVLEIAP